MKGTVAKFGESGTFQLRYDAETEDIEEVASDLWELCLAFFEQAYGKDRMSDSAEPYVEMAEAMHRASDAIIDGRTTFEDWLDDLKAWKPAGK